MDLSPWTIYFIMQASEIREALMVVAALSAVCVAASFFAQLLTWEHSVGSDRSDKMWMDRYNSWRKRNIRAVLLLPFVFAVLTFAPTTKSLVAAFGLPLLIKSAETVGLDDTAKTSIKAVNKLLETYLKEEGDKNK